MIYDDTIYDYDNRYFVGCWQSYKYFDEYYEDTMLLNVRIHGDINGSKVELSVVPAMQDDGRTTIFTEESEKNRVFNYLEEISINVDIDEKGVVHSKE